MCRTSCRGSSKLMRHLCLFVFIQTSCVLLRSLHIRKCWQFPLNQQDKPGCVWSLFISAGNSNKRAHTLLHILLYSACELWYSTVFCVTVNKRLTLQRWSSSLHRRYMLIPSNHNTRGNWEGQHARLCTLILEVFLAIMSWTAIVIVIHLWFHVFLCEYRHGFSFLHFLC